MNQPEEKIGIVWMRPGQPPRYFQLPRALALKKMAAAIRHAERRGYCFPCEKAEAALAGLLQREKE